jgi:S-adenosylmethionine-diacylglycerol 3-amino-3-carboxypropyl transferase
MHNHTRMADITQRARFDIIRYANVWEDADVLCDALQPLAGKNILSIASGGDNAFAMIAEGANVTAVDVSAAQLHVVELKRAAILHLSYEELLPFLGIQPSTNRLATYESISGELTVDARLFWRDNQHIIEPGVVHGGKFERYFELFRNRVLPFVHTSSHVEALLSEKSREERDRFFKRTWNSWRWRAMFSLFFSRFVMGRLGRDPEFFRYVEGSVAKRIRGRADYALTALPTHTNPYLTFIFTGNYRNALPRYLRPDKLAAVRANMHRLELKQGLIDEVAVKAGKKFDGYNLSDIFEYLDAATAERIYGALLDASNRGARFVYWNMLVPRQRPEKFARRVSAMSETASQLFARDLAFFYSALVIEEVQ